MEAEQIHPDEQHSNHSSHHSDGKESETSLNQLQSDAGSRFTETEMKRMDTETTEMQRIKSESNTMLEKIESDEIPDVD